MSKLWVQKANTQNPIIIRFMAKICSDMNSITRTTIVDKSKYPLKDLSHELEFETLYSKNS